MLVFLLQKNYGTLMIIKDEGYVLSAKQYGEKALIVTLLTKSKGKIAGFVSEGAGKKNRGLFQPGNKLFFEASARLEENNAAAVILSYLKLALIVFIFII